MEFLSGFLTQIMSTAGVIFLFGWIIAILRRGFCKVAGRSGPKILLITCIVGTPIHELSHALMCVLFGHNITDIQLYNPKSDDGTLGHVSHTYNKKNIYHQIGNFFIGIAPVLLGGGVVILLLSLLLPDAFDVISSQIEALSDNNLGTLPILEFLAFILTAILEIFSFANFSAWQGWVFIILALMIATHMEMSGSDIKSGLRGLMFLLIIMLLFDGAIYSISPNTFFIITGAIASFGYALAAIFSISALFLLLLLIFATILRGIGSIFSK